MQNGRIKEQMERKRSATRARIIYACSAVASTLAVMPAADAAAISWFAPGTIVTANSALSQVGQVYEAAAWGNPGSVTYTDASFGSTIITFTSGTTNGGAGTVADVNPDGGPASSTSGYSGSGNSGFDTVLGGFAYDGNGTDPNPVITIKGLTTGEAFSVQIFAIDDRNFNNIGNRTESYSDGTNQSASIKLGSNQYVIGAFVPTSTTQTVNIIPGNGSNSNLNALVVRNLGQVWSGTANGNWDTSSANFSGLNYSQVIAENGGLVYFADTDSSGNPVATSSVTVQAGGVTPTYVTFNNNSVAYALGGGAIGGNASMALLGSGTVTLNSANTFSGPTTINAGALVLGHSLAVQNTTVSVNVNNGLQFAAGLGSATLGGLGGSGNLSLQDNAGSPAAIALTVGGNNGNSTYSGALSGSGSLVKTGTGILNLAGNNTFSGGTTVNQGTLQLSYNPNDDPTGTLVAGSSLTIGTGATVEMTVDDALGYHSSATASTNISGGTLTIDAGHHATLQGVILTGGTLTAAGTGDFAGNGNSNYIIDGNVTVAASANVSTISAPSILLRGTPAGGNTTGPVTFNVTSGGGTVDLLVSGTIGDHGESEGLIKTGNGTMKVTGPLTYRGNTSISAGTLNVVSQQFTSGNVSIAGGATLEETISSTSGSYTLGTSNINFTGNGTLLFDGTGEPTFGGYSGGVIYTTINLSQGALIDVEKGELKASSFNAAVWSSNQASMKIATNAAVDTYEASIFVDSLTGNGTLSGGYYGTSTTTVGVAGGSGNFTGKLANQTDTSISGIFALTKSGSGTETLSGSNSYTGSTTVTGGTLALSTSLTNNIAPSRAITVGSGATLDVTGVTGSGHFALNGTGTQSTSQAIGGVGTVKGDITIASAATISAGTNSSLNTGSSTTFGTLTTTFGTTTFGTSGIYSWKDSAAPANGVAGTDWDTLSLSGLNVTSTNGAKFVIALNGYNGTGGSLGGTPTGLSNNSAQYSWIIAQTTNAATINGTTASLGTPLTSGLNSDVFALDTTNFDIGGTQASASAFTLEFIANGNGSGGDNLVLTYDSTPEPGIGMMVLCGAAPFFSARRRRRMNSVGSV